MPVHLYDISGRDCFCVDGETIYDRTGRATYYIGTVFTMNGKPTFWIADDFLFAYPDARTSYYFGDP